MKTIHTIIASIKDFLGLGTPKETPQLIAVIQENFCQNVASTTNCCDENNLFI
jgi:hypothetical protein